MTAGGGGSEGRIGAPVALRPATDLGAGCGQDPGHAWPPTEVSGWTHEVLWSSSYPVVIVDLDSTLCDTRHRHHLSPHRRGLDHSDDAWRDYAMAAGEDTPILGTCRLVTMLAESGCSIQYLTGRSFEARAITLRWLYHHGLPISRRTALRMRLRGEESDHATWKRGFLQAMLDAGYSVSLAIDDWPGVSHAFHELGVPTVVPNPMYRDDPMEWAVQQTQDPTAASDLDARLEAKLARLSTPSPT